MRLLAAPLLFLAAGLPLAAPLSRGRGRLAVLGWGYTLGLAWTGTALYALSHLLHVPLRRGPIAAVALVPLVTLVALRSRGRAPRPAAPTRRASLVPLVPAVVGGLVCLGVLAETTTNPFSGWDDRAIWAAHARYVRAAGSVDAPAFRDARIAVEVPRYPALLPVVQSAVQEMLGADDERMARTLYGWALVSFLLILFAEAEARAGTAAASATTCAAALLPMLTFESDGGAVSGYSDVPLALLWGGAVLLLFGRPRGRASAALAALLLAAAVLAKDEGVALAANALLAGSLSARAFLRAARRRTGRHLLAWAALPLVAVLLAAALLASWRAAIPLRLDPKFSASLGPGLLLRGVTRRYPLLFVAMLKQMQRPDRWGLFFVTAPIVFYAGRRALRRRAALPLALAVVASLSCYGLAYAVTRLNPFSLVIVTWSRFLVQVSLVLLVLFAVALREAFARPRLGLGLVPVAALCLFTLATDRLHVRWPYNDVGLGPTKETALSPEQLVWPDPKSLPPPLLPRRDETIPGAIDDPPEGAAVEGPLRVSGWAQEQGSGVEILAIELDGRKRRLLSFARTPRPDVAKALPRLGACERAGYESVVAPDPEDSAARGAAPHELTVRFLAGDRTRALTRRFAWKP